MLWSFVGQQESSEETELRAALAASVTDTHFKPVCYDLSDSDSNDTDISEVADDDELAGCSSSGAGAVLLDDDSCKKSSIDSSSACNSKKLRTETASPENSIDSDNCVGSLHDATQHESLISHNDVPVSAVEEKASSWKYFFGPESGNLLCNLLGSYLHLATSEIWCWSWRRGILKKYCLYVTVLCTIIMVHKSMSSSYRSVNCIGLWSCLVQFSIFQAHLCLRSSWYIIIFLLTSFSFPFSELSLVGLALDVVD